MKNYTAEREKAAQAIASFREGVRDEIKELKLQAEYMQAGADAETAALMAKNKVNGAQDELTDSLIEAKRRVEDLTEAQRQYEASLNDVFDAIDSRARSFDGDLQSALTPLDGQAAPDYAPGADTFNKDVLDQLEAEMRAFREKVGIIVDDAATEYHQKAMQGFTEFINADDFDSAAARIREAFENIGDPIAGLIDGMSAFVRVTKAAGDVIQSINMDPLLSDQEKQAAIAQVQQRAMREQVGTYGDMAGAASQFFDKGSKGYKTLQAVSTAFHAAELAATIAELVPKGISAVLSQGSGDPYSAFGRMAAMAAIVAGLGVAIGGAGGGGSYKPPTTGVGAGKGTVLGDANATSESIKNSLETLVSLQDKGLYVSQSMLSALQAIEAGINGVGDLLYRTNAGTGGGATPFNVPSSSRANHSGTVESAIDFIQGTSGITLDSKLSQKVLGIDTADFDIGAIVLRALVGKTKVKQVDEGLLFDAAQSIGDIMAGNLDALYYAVIKITKKNLFGSDSKYKTLTESVDDELTRQFTDIISGLGQSVLDAVGILGGDMEAAVAALNELPLGFDKISFEGLSGTEVQDKLNAVFSALGDTFAETLMPGIEEFQQTGEGLYETLIRVAAQTDAISKLFTRLGSDIASTVDAMDLAKIADQLITLSGGIDQFSSNLNDYLQGFYSEDERAALQRAQINDTLATVGFTLPETSEGFRALVESLTDTSSALNVTTEEGQKAYAALLSIAGAADSVYDASVKAAQAAQQAAEQAVADAQQKLQQAQQNLIGAYNAAISAASAAVDKWRDLERTMRDFADSLLDRLIPATSAATAMFKREYDVLAEQARAGNASAMNQLPSAGNAYLDQLRNTAGSALEYALGVASVRSDALLAADAAGGRADSAQAQLAALQGALEELIKQSEIELSQVEATLSVTEAVNALAQAEADYASAIAAQNATQNAQISSLQQQVSALRNTPAPAVYTPVGNSTAQAPQIGGALGIAMNAALQAIAISSAKTAQTLQRVVPDGDALATRAAT